MYFKLILFTTFLGLGQPAGLEGAALPCPPAAPASGRVFCSSQELDERKAYWARRIADMNRHTAIEWIVGQTDCYDIAATLRHLRSSTTDLSAEKRDRLVLCEAFEEAQHQIDALRAALPEAAARGARGPLRSFGRQRQIWEGKYLFRPSRGAFGSIRRASREACVAAAGDDAARRARRREIFPVGGEWHADGSHATEHRQCWKEVLTPGQRQREILQTSSAPGISRHHFGTDVDLGTGGASLINVTWSPGGRFADAYQWLQDNAIAYGMIQPYDAGRGGGYLEERWHWSYYPIAQALLELVAENEADVGSRLEALWDQRLQALINAGEISRAAPGNEQEDPYGFVRDHWREYVFQVRAGPVPAGER